MQGLYQSRELFKDPSHDFYNVFLGGCQNSGPFLGPKHKIRHLLFRVPKRDHNSDNHPYISITGYWALWVHEAPERVETDFVVASPVSRDVTRGRIPFFGGAQPGCSK